MKTQAQCLICMVSQVVNTMQLGNSNEQELFDHTCTLLNTIRSFKREDPPAYSSSIALNQAYKLMGNEDPYAEIKAQSNRDAQEYYSFVEKTIAQAPDKLFAAFQAAVAGNIIDFGVSKQYDLEAELRLSLHTGFTRNDYPLFREKLESSNTVLILGDNSGEIVFDQFLVKELIALGKTVTYMVKGEPLLNDATMHDAVETGMTKLTEVVTTGAKFIGFDRRVVSQEALARFDAAPLVIAKGMANFETLHGQKQAEGKTFSVLKAKCDTIAQATGVNLYDLVFLAL